MKADKKLIKFTYEQVRGANEKDQRLDDAFDILFDEVMQFIRAGNSESTFVKEFMPNLKNNL